MLLRLHGREVPHDIRRAAVAFPPHPDTVHALARERVEGDRHTAIVVGLVASVGDEREVDRTGRCPPEVGCTANGKDTSTGTEDLVARPARRRSHPTAAGGIADTWEAARETGRRPK